MLDYRRYVIVLRSLVEKVRCVGVNGAAGRQLFGGDCLP